MRDAVGEHAKVCALSKCHLSFDRLQPANFHMILVSRANSVGSAGVSYCSCSKLLPRDQYTRVIYCAPQTPCILVREIRRQSRASFWRIESAVAVHTNGSAFALWVWMK